MCHLVTHKHLAGIKKASKIAANKWDKLILWPKNANFFSVLVVKAQNDTQCIYYGPIMCSLSPLFSLKAYKAIFRNEKNEEIVQ